MTRFEADDPTERRKLFADAVVAHRDRGSPYLTIEADGRSDDGGDGDPAQRDVGAGAAGASAASAGASADSTGTDAGPDRSGGEAEAPVAPWIQFSERTVNVDCTDRELARLKDLLSEFPEFRIDRLERPEGAGGTNVRITARSDASRLADFFDRVFREVYDRDEDYRAWVVEI
jgi:hypothetical protein